MWRGAVCSLHKAVLLKISAVQQIIIRRIMLFLYYKEINKYHLVHSLYPKRSIVPDN